ncbi:hypothetical protein FHG87_012833 [Trinorchestia longiramus]|nr:hypothetical protein FHG87_012833 [Trinorchestia longiramus]
MGSWREQQPLIDVKGLASLLCDGLSKSGRFNPGPSGVLVHGRQGTALKGISQSVSIHNTLSTTASTSDRVDSSTENPSQICDLTHYHSYAASYLTFPTCILHIPHLTRTVQPAAMKGTMISILLLVAIAFASAGEENEAESKDTFAEADVIQRQLGISCSCSGSSGRPRFRCRDGEKVLCRIYRFFRCCEK